MAFFIVVVSIYITSVAFGVVKPRSEETELAEQIRKITRSR